MDPQIMIIGPTLAIKKLLNQTSYELKDIRLLEINEGFVAPSAVVEPEIGLKPEIVKANGVGIALGHPIENTGCRLVAP
jgi:acetyl-CoA C-acetyltransferase